MLDSKNINELVKNLMDSLPSGVTNLTKDIERNFQGILQSAFKKMDLVTREEFDAQTKVLLRTRMKLEQLEKQLQELENRRP
jgi:hypothetical protein